MINVTLKQIQSWIPCEIGRSIFKSRDKWSHN